MKRRFRLTRASDFERVRRLGRSYAHPLVVLIALPNEAAGVRVGVAAGKSLGKAVSRNRAKRVLRAAARPLLPLISPGYDLLLLARRPLLESKGTQAQDVIRTLLKRAGLLIEHHDR